MTWRFTTKDEQTTYCSTVTLSPKESLVYFTKTREIRKVKGYDSLDMARFDKFDWDCADKIGVKIPTPPKPPQWTIRTVAPDGTMGRYQINYWEMVWNSQQAAEKVIKEQEESYPKESYKLKAVLCSEVWSWAS